MKQARRRGLCLLLAALAGAPVQAATEHYRGLCDASAAVALDVTHFVVANDEDNLLRLYTRGEPEPAGTLPLAGLLGSGQRESDIEGAARIGNRIYWIASHGRNSSGKKREERHRFFAVEAEDGLLLPTGAAYTRLLDDMAAAPTLRHLKLKDAAALPPEAPGGLNIEGLAAMPDGGLLVGFRNPIPNGRALVVPLLNPAEVIDRGQPARFGEPLLLPLRNRGIRSMEWAAGAYWIVAGPTADRGSFSLYRWSGRPADAPQLLDSTALADLRPEALFAWPGSPGGLQVLSDDGGVELGGVACKQRPVEQQRFRALGMALPQVR
ncbi:MAG: DUF3616 domain-containing protein [Aquincola tertiaricarbonis]